MGRGFQTKSDGSRFASTDYTERHAEVFANRYDDGLGTCKIATFRRLLGDLDELRVLDLGCGEGTFSRITSQEGAYVVATDFAASMVAATSQRAAVPVVRASAESIPYIAGSFDIVLALDIIEHLYQPEVALDEIHRVLAPGGRLVLATDREGVALGDLPLYFPKPIRRLVASRGVRGTAADPSRYRTPMCTHTHEFPLPELLALTAERGFQLDKVDTYPHRTSYGGWGRAVELIAQGPFRKWKWDYVMVVLSRSSV